MKLTLAEIADAVGGELIVGRLGVHDVDGQSETQSDSQLDSRTGVQSGVQPDVQNSSALDAVVCGEIDATWSTIEATSVTWDSREVVPGSLFVALPGERVDGHHFVAAAMENGAVAALVSYKMAAPCPQILVKDTYAAFSQLASYWRGKLTGTIIGITGSTGKTTTKGLVRDVLAQAGSVVATKANQNNELGVPNTLLSANTDTDFVVVEMGMRGLGQIAELCSMARPDWGVITNIGESHCELLGSRENIARAKAELFQALPDDGCAFVNTDSDFAEELVEYGELLSRGVRIVAVGTQGDHSCFQPDRAVQVVRAVWAQNITLDKEGHPSFVLCAASAQGEEAFATCTLKLYGMHNVSNACMAAAVGLIAGLSIDQCAAALARVEPEDGRQSFKQMSQGGLLIDDAYNASPDSMRASFETFAAVDVDGRRIAVLGDMGELGESALDAHRTVGRMAANAGIDMLICAGELAREIAQGAIDAGLPEENVRIMDNAVQALEHIKDNLNADDAVLVKASHFMGFERIVEGLME